MTREDIIRMAREAGLHIATDVNWMPIIGLEYAERFAALVLANNPPQRTWAGLTEDEAFACKGRDYFETYRAIEAKLKEKNT